MSSCSQANFPRLTSTKALSRSFTSYFKNFLTNNSIYESKKITFLFFYFCTDILNHSLAASFSFMYRFYFQEITCEGHVLRITITFITKISIQSWIIIRGNFIAFFIKCFYSGVRYVIQYLPLLIISRHLS